MDTDKLLYLKADQSCPYGHPAPSELLENPCEEYVPDLAVEDATGTLLLD